MFFDPKGPVEHFSWGKFIIAGKEHSKDFEKIGVGKDIQVVGKKVKAWKSRKGHTLSKKMFKDVLEYDIDVIVIGTGVHGMIECSGEIINYIRKKNISEVFLKKTPEACELYNKLYHEGRKVALLAHGTC